MVDILSLGIGFIIGVVVVAIAIEFGSKKTKNVMPSSRRTLEWDINEIQNPKIMAEYLGDIAIPKESRVLVNKYKDIQMFKGLNAKRSTRIKGNYILGDDRALILSGPLKKDEIGFWTVEKDIVDSLHQEFDAYWQKASVLETEK
jgi:hypothetical protein